MTADSAAVVVPSSSTGNGTIVASDSKRHKFNLSTESVLTIAGAVCGAFEAIAVQPFDMVKTRHQLNSLENESVYLTLKNLHLEGGVRRFYRGMGAELLGIVPKSSGMYASYELVKRECDKMPGWENSSMSAYIAGFASGFPESFIVTPTQVIKVRLQAKEHLGRYSGIMECITKTIKSEGITALYTGLSPTLFRNCIWNTIYFGTMHWLKQKLPTPSNKAIDLGQTLLTGFSAAVFATCFNAPFDVVKSRFQSELRVPNQPRVYQHTIPSLIMIIRNEGIQASYKGFLPKAIRMGLGGAVAMASFELTQYLLLA